MQLEGRSAEEPGSVDRCMGDVSRGLLSPLCFSLREEKKPLLGKPRGPISDTCSLR